MTAQTETPTREPLLHILPMQPPRYAADDRMRSALDIRMRGRHQGRVCRFGVGYSALGREVHQGPLVPDIAYTYALATVISATPMPEDPYIDVAEGDLLLFAGFLWRIADDKPYHDPQLVRVARSTALPS